MHEVNADLIRRKIEAVLPRVQRPTRYLGNELNVRRKRDGEIETRVALVFPEVYEIGMSWPGQQILYHLLNERPGVSAERCYAFWPDMETEMRAEGIPSFSLETWTPLSRFDIVGFTLQYELLLTNILTILDLAHIPFRSRDRRRDDPLILAGGPVAFNCEPIADFLDAVVLGDGEDVFGEICDVQRAWKKSGAPRIDLLRKLSKLAGVYVPSFYNIRYADEPVSSWHMPAITAIDPHEGAPAAVRRRFVEDLNRVPFPSRPIVPLGGTVHNRLGIEVQRGCTRACRFCQAGYIYRPERQRDPEQVKRLVAESLKNTGYDDISLLSLSIGDYGCLDDLLGDIVGPKSRGTTNVSVSLPAIRVDTLTEGIVDKVAAGKKSGFTMAPEAGSPRLRDVINKALSEEQIANAAEMVFSRGWSHIKFYYMIGVPTETDDDVMGIVRTARMCRDIGRKYTRKADIHVSTSTFVPKPFTPFQWEPQISRGEILRRQQMLAHELRGMTYKWHDATESFLEAVLSRGDRRLADVIEWAWAHGARFDGWREHSRIDVWREAFAACGVEPGFYAHRRIPLDEVLPWDHIDCGVTKKWLKKDWEFALRERFIPDCATGRCYDCGVCDFEVVKNRTYVSQESGYIPQGARMTPKGIGAHPVPIETRGKARLADLLPPKPVVPDDEVTKYRIRFEKVGRAAYLGHLDLLDHIGRAFTRAGMRVAYSTGFHPRPRMSFGPALMTGALSRSEWFDVELLPPIPDTDWLATVNTGLPEGVALLEAQRVARWERKLGRVITGAIFELSERLPGTLPALEDRRRLIAEFLGRENVEVTTSKKTYNVRPFVNDAMATHEGLRLDISFDTDRGSAKPTDVARAIFRWDEPHRTDGLLVSKLMTHFESPRQTGEENEGAQR